MRRHELEHVVRAAAEVVEEDEMIVVGSQAILGTYPDAPEPLLLSIEADIYPRRAPEKAEQIDGALGDGSQFHRSYGYYAHGVGPETARAPRGWELRLIRVAVEARTGSEREPVALCLEPHDLVLAKCAAGRERDWEFAREALRGRIVDRDELLARIDDMPLDPEGRAHLRRMLGGIVAGLSGPG